MSVHRVFPSGGRRFVRIPPRKIYERLLNYMRSSPKVEEIKDDRERLSISAKISERLGASVDLRVHPEDDSSTVELSLSYKRLMLAVLGALILSAGLSIALKTVLPLTALLLLVPIAHKVNGSATTFLGTLIGSLSYLEAEYAKETLMEARRRWRETTKDTEKLYRRLIKKHMETWGNTNVLEYKIAEYERLGLTREEAIRKAAEEEGIQ